MNIYKNKKILPLFLLPAFIFIAVFLFYPFVMNIVNSFKSIRILGSSASSFNEPWYLNYVKMANDVHVKTSLKNTGIMIVVTIVGQVGIALLLALLVDNIAKGTKFYRTVYFFPIVISATALGLLFNLIFLYDKGMINQLREVFGYTTLVDFKDESHAIKTMMLPVVWQYIGFYFVIIETGLNNIPKSLYESARIDGASRWDCIRYISLPMIKPVVGTCMILGVTGALKVFDLPWIMFPKGMPLKSTFLTGTYMYYQTMEVKDVDYGSALAVLIVVLGVILAFVTNKIFNKKETDYE